ncbi:MAG: aldo/keto reductase [Lachnospiraceae bacterium]|nr:aldo/keto reductase [Lachnospiraceae bacterium]
MNKNFNIKNTELFISPMGMGTVDAGVAWGRDAKSADSMFGTFIEAGGNLIDCAHVYSDWIAVDGIHEIGRCERVTGDWMKRMGNRHDIVLTSKGGHPVFTNPNYDLHINRCSKADMRGDLEGSLELLKTDYIDIYFYHRDDPRIPIEDMVETMEDFVREGKIRYWAVSNWTPERINAAVAYCKKMGYRGPIADQSLLNLGAKYMNPLADDTMLACKGDLYDLHKNNLEVLEMPFMGNASGFFHIYAAKGEEGVKNSPYCTEKNLQIAKRVVELTKKYDCAVTNIVLGYFGQEAFPCVPLYGPFNEESIKEAARTFDIKFDPEDYKF